MERQVSSPESILHGAEQEHFSRRFSPMKAMHLQVPHPLPVRDPQSWRFMGGGKVFLPREEKLGSEGRCWA